MECPRGRGDAARWSGNGLGMGRELFAGMRRNALSAEEGACTWL
jgi:phosphogluconate dehydratase